MHVCNNLQQITLPHDATHSCLQCSTMIQTATHHNAFTSTAICRKSHCHMTQCAMNAYMSTATYCELHCHMMHRTHHDTYLPQFTANLVTAISCNVHIFTMICSTPHDHAMQHAHVHSDVQRIMLPCNATCAHLQQSAARFYLKSILPWSQVSCVRAMRRVMGMQEGNRKGDGAVGR